LFCFVLRWSPLAGARQKESVKVVPTSLYPQKAPQKAPQICANQMLIAQADVPRHAVGLFPHKVQALLDYDHAVP